MEYGPYDTFNSHNLRHYDTEIFYILLLFREFNLVGGGVHELSNSLKVGYYGYFLSSIILGSFQISIFIIRQHIILRREETRQYSVERL